MADYFPLVEGAVREYALESSSGAGRFKVEVLGVETKGGVTTAKCRRTLNLPGEPGRIVAFTVMKDASGVHEDGAFEFKNPVTVGTEWVRPPRRFWIEALRLREEKKAGVQAGPSSRPPGFT